ncbi:MAG TPA: hypothetical protein VFJ90_08920, partial [Candidatus Didemnitutus sp.]|nr:hypothetical protein [Candidatus Didemnitutus sp.]
EPEAWQRAEQAAQHQNPSARDLFRGAVRSTTIKTTLVCALGLSAWWLFLFWHPQHFRRILTADHVPPPEILRLVSLSFLLVNTTAIAGNFAGGWLARRLGNPRAIAIMFAGLGVGIVGAFIVPRSFGEMAWFWCPVVGFFSGVFGLFTMYLPPLFPTLLRTTGAGFCYNIGRTAAAAASIVFGWLAPVGDFRAALLVSSLLAFAAALAAISLPADEKGAS